MLRIEALYREYKQEIYRYLLSLTHDPVLSEDLLSETFVAAIKGIFSFQGKAAIKTWLFSIARNVWLSHIRKEKNVVEYREQMGLYITESVEECFIKSQTAARIEELLSAMDSRIQSVVRMRIDGYSYHIIAKELAISESAARVIDFRAKRQIRSILEKEGYWNEA